MTITIKHRHEAHCSRCGARETYDTHPEAMRWTDEHSKKHAHMRENGERMVGKVFDTQGPGVPWLGDIVHAVRAAKEAGKPYLSWNGYVYITDDVDFRHPMCLAEDVGLT